MSNFLIGPRISNFNDLIRQEFIFFGPKVYHRGWFMSWPMRTVEVALRKGDIRYAMRRENAIEYNQSVSDRRTEFESVRCRDSRNESRYYL